MTSPIRTPLIHECALNASTEKAFILCRTIILSAGIPASEISEEPQHFCLKIFSKDAGYIKRVQSLFKKLALPGVRVTCRALKPEAWLTRWKKDWKPSRLTGKLDIVPIWCRATYKPAKGRDFIVLDTIMSFGTGLHETTQIMAGFIEKHRDSIATFMDIGTGTGILAMVALKHGAKKVLAMDFDELSVEAAENNLKANGLKATVKQADIGKFRHATQYNFVAANLITHDLITHGHAIVNFVKPGGYLAVSGISLENFDQLRKAFTKLPLTLIEQKKGKQWSGLLYSRRMS